MKKFNILFLAGVFLLFLYEPVAAQRTIILTSVDSSDYIPFSLNCNNRNLILKSDNNGKLSLTERKLKSLANLNFDFHLIRELDWTTFNNKIYTWQSFGYLPFKNILLKDLFRKKHNHLYLQYKVSYYW